MINSLFRVTETENKKYFLSHVLSHTHPVTISKGGSSMG